MSPGRPSRFRFDVYTDAGKGLYEFLYLIADNCPPTEAYALQRSLTKRGWRVELRPVEADRDPLARSWRGIHNR